MGEEGGTKTLSTRTLCQVGRSIVEFRPRLRSWRIIFDGRREVWKWKCRVVTSRWAVSETVDVAGGWEVTVHMMPSAGRSPESPGPGEDCRRLQGRTTLLRTQYSGGWVLQEALRAKQLLAALVSSVDWVVRGTYRTAWAVTPRCRCPHGYGRGVAVGHKRVNDLGSFAMICGRLSHP